MAETTILIVDDDADFTASMKAVLEAEGYRVVAASSGKEGLGKLAESKPDLVLLDIMMESTTEGYAVSAQIKYGPHAVPVIMVSSVEYGPAELFARSEELEMVRPDAYVTKPVDVPQFLETLKGLLSKRARA